MPNLLKKTCAATICICLCKAMRRTRIQDYTKIEEAKDLDSVVNDKRKRKRATKKKATRRNRRYQNYLLNHLTKNIDEEYKD